MYQWETIFGFLYHPNYTLSCLTTHDYETRKTTNYVIRNAQVFPYLTILWKSASTLAIIINLI